MSDQNDNDKIKEFLLVEYQSSQDSAQHHDNLVWTVTSIIWAANLVLFGFVLQTTTATLDLQSQIFVTALCLLGIYLTVFVQILALQFRDIKKSKYKRCNEIKDNNFPDIPLKNDQNHPEGSQKCWYLFATILFSLIWVIAIVVIWIPK